MVISQDQLKEHYAIENGSKYQDWYTARPYGFRFTDNEGASSSFNLPILPKNINITTQFATNIVNTLYGVVEQHSDNKFYDIQIQGTTGFGPQFINVIDSEDSPASPGRQGFSNSTSVLGGFLPNVENKINSIGNSVRSLANALSGKSDNQTGIYNDNNGYVAFHNFYRFLLEYKKQISGTAGSAAGISLNPVAAMNKLSSLGKSGPSAGSSASLVFYNYKDMQEYECAIRSFTLSRSADSPFLYNYSISLRAYNLRSISKSGNFTSLNAIKEDTGVNGISVFSSMSRVVGNAASLISGIL